MESRPVGDKQYIVTKATAEVILGNLSHIFDGSQKSATATTVPSGLAVDITYNGSLVPPINVGSYTVTGMVNDAMYEASATGTMVINSKVHQTITFTKPGDQLRAARIVLQAQASSGLPVEFVVLSGPALIIGSSNLIFTGIGTVRIAARQSGNGYWNAASQIVVTIKVLGTVINDYDGDGISDPAVFYPTLGQWFIRRLTDDVLAWAVEWGSLVTAPVPGDYDGDGRADLAVYNRTNGQWDIRSLTGVGIALATNWGFQGAVPVYGDYNGDGKSDLAVFHPESGQWFIRTLGSSGYPVLAWYLKWGFAGSQPVAGDFDGDGKSDLAIYDPNSAKWYILSLKGKVIGWGLEWGFKDGIPVSGDYDGDGKSDLAVYDPVAGKWYIRDLNGHPIAWAMEWGFDGVLPVPGDYDGDRKSDLAVYDPATGKWFIRTVAGKVLAWRLEWGWNASVPVVP